MKNTFKTNIKFWIVFLLLSSGLSAQTQKGGDIDGEFDGDLSGYSVSMPEQSIFIQIFPSLLIAY